MAPNISRGYFLIHHHHFDKFDISFFVQQKSSEAMNLIKCKLSLRIWKM